MDHATADAQPVAVDMSKWARYGRGLPPPVNADSKAITRLQAEVALLSRIVEGVREAEQNRWTMMGQDGNVKQSLDFLLEQTNAHWETMDRTLLKLDATLRDNTAALQAATGAKMECLVCMDKERNTVILPCSHYAVCGECLVQCRNCPVCRGPMGGSIKVYVVYSGGALGLTSLL